MEFATFATGAATMSVWDVLKTSSTATQVCKTGAMDGPRHKT
jgi:hypothetical protein